MTGADRPSRLNMYSPISAGSSAENSPRMMAMRQRVAARRAPMSPILKRCQIAGSNFHVQPSPPSGLETGFSEWRAM